jgi:dTDP-4-amino-4,6-dideoxygalactose transaminase
MEPVPFIDLRRSYLAHKPAIDRAIAEVVESQAFILGPAVERLERAVAQLVGVKHAIGVASGTDALVLSLLALGVGVGDEVVTTPWSFFATASSIARTGATPVFCDIDPQTWCIDPDAAARLIRERPRVRAVMPVHLYGLVPDLGPLLDAARERGVHVVEDAAQAIGAHGPQGNAGAIGACGCFSFYPTKNVGAFGDAGMVTTDDDALAERLHSLRWHGTEPPRSYNHTALGLCSRMGGIQGAVLEVRMQALEDSTSSRRANAVVYDAQLEGSGLGLPDVPDGHVVHQYSLRVTDGRRDALREHLKERGVGSGLFYPLPLHQQPALAGRCVVDGEMTHSERAAEEVLQLPVFPELTVDERDRVVNAVLLFTGA